MKRISLLIGLSCALCAILMPSLASAAEPALAILSSVPVDIGAALAMSAAPAARSFHGISGTPRADAQGSAAMIEALNKNWEDFKAANDERLKGIDDKFDDVVTNDKVDKINASIEDVTKALDDIAKKNAALELSAGASGVDLAANAKAFAIASGEDPENAMAPDDYQKYCDATNRYLRKGQNNAGSAVMNLMETGSDPNGGYTVPTEMSDKIIKKIYETSDVRSEADVTSIGTDMLQGFEDREEVDTGWVGEKQDRTETGTPGLGLWEIPVHEQYAEPRVTQKLLDDSAWDIEGWLAGKVAEKMGRVENATFLTGDGILKPKGLLTYATSTADDATRAWKIFQHIVSGSNTAISDDEKLIDLVFSLKAGYRSNAKWFMNRKSVSEVRKLKDGDGNYLWQPNFSERQGGELLGYMIREFEDMPDIAQNANAIGFGDMRQAYTVVDRVGIRVLRDPFTKKGFIKFYTTKRTGGGAQDYESMKFLKISV